MPGLLGLLSPPKPLEPAEPTALDGWLGRYADPSATFENQFDIALLMAGVMLAVLVWRTIRNRPAFLKAVAPDLPKALEDEQFKQNSSRVISGILVVIALVASINYFYGTRNNGVYVHRWDSFHTVIGVKYFRELGYFDLYKCAYAADREGPHHFRAVEKIRDLRTRKHVRRDEHIAGNDCKERFTPERWEEFTHDLDEFGTWSPRRNWKRLMMDKGFNGTPFYATAVKPFVTSIDVSIEGLKKLAKIDPFLMVVAFVLVGWAYGPRTAAVAAIFFCVFFPNRFTHMGGSILRFDYVATLLAGFAFLKKEKWGVAGGLFAWATMVRVFPAIFAVGVGLKIAADVYENKWKFRPEHIRFAAAFGGCVALFFLISLVGMDGGIDNWRTWYENMKIHNRTTAAYRVGFKHLFMLDGDLMATHYPAKHELLAERENYYFLSVLLLLGPVVASVRRLDTISFAAIFGVVGFFTLAIATRYYYGVVAILFLIDRDVLKSRFMLMLGALLFSATAFDFFWFELNDNNPFMYNVLVSFEVALAAALIASFLVMNPSLLDVGEDPRLPKVVPAAAGARATPVPLPKVKKKKKKKKKKKAKAKARAKAKAAEARSDDADERAEDKADEAGRRDEGEMNEADEDEADGRDDEGEADDADEDDESKA